MTTNISTRDDLPTQHAPKTLRDEFAMAALSLIPLPPPGMIMHPRQFDDAAMWAYKIADAMMAKRASQTLDGDA